MGEQSISDHDNVISLQGHLRPEAHTNPHGEITGLLFLCTYWLFVCLFACFSHEKEFGHCSASLFCPSHPSKSKGPPLQEGHKSQLKWACHLCSWGQKALLYLADYWTIKASRGEFPSVAWTTASQKGNGNFSLVLPHLLYRLPELQLGHNSQGLKAPQ